MLFVNSPYCFTNWANLPLVYLGDVRLAVEKVGFQNFVEDEACLEEGNCLELLLLLLKSFLVSYVKDCV